MNFSDYQLPKDENPVTCPSKPIKPGSKATSNDYRNYADQLESYEIAKKAYKAYCNDRSQKQYELEKKFKIDALKEVGLDKHPKANKIYAYAWDRGHFGGLSEVYNQLLDLVDLFE